VGFADRDPARLGAAFAGSSVTTSESDLLKPGGSNDDPELERLAHGIGDNQTRWRAHERAGADRFVALAHPSAVVSPSATVGCGTVILAAATVNPDAVVGEAVILNTGCVVEHDCIVEDGAHIAPGAILAGGVTVRRLAWIGARACVVPGVEIGANAIVGAGSVVLENVPAGATVVGNPARVLRARD
jgi:sugar O-acyltransferase (sialic acid O-acetyltransferase NeuD family)